MEDELLLWLPTEAMLWFKEVEICGLQPLNMTRQSSEFSRPHDSLRIHFAELEFGVVLPRSTSGVDAVSEGNLPLTQLTSVDIGVRASAPKQLRRRIFTGASLPRR